MSTPLLTAKLYRPHPRPNAVSRPRLIERLNAGLAGRLTLVSAPAGFGKTTLVSSWAASSGRAVAWLALDGADNDPNRFLAYLVAALQTLEPTIGTDLLAAVQSSQATPLDALLPSLINAMARLGQPALLVLDDYHVIDAEPIIAALDMLVEHLPPQLHLVIATRQDPALPLARLRARGHLAELRAADLRFTMDEAAGFLNQVMGLNLVEADIARLEARTEGWVAGLQLAALSLQGHQDVPGFIQSFAGDHRYIVDYLVDEVLQRQPAAVRSFLLQTAILERLHGPLCDAVTGQSGGSARLEALQRGNFFVIPLDDSRHWYRYHHLFGDVLAAQLQAEQPDLLPILHRRASIWYEQHGAAPDAIRHALIADDFARAADLIELAAPAMHQSRQEATLLGWLKALPDALIAGRPVVCVYYAGTLLTAGELVGVERYLREAEGWLDRLAHQNERPLACSDGPIVRDTEALRQLPGSIAVYRAAQAMALGDLSQSMVFAQQALQHLDQDNHVMCGAAHALLGLAYWSQGDLVAASRSYADGMQKLQLAGHIADAIGGSITLADIRKIQGRLREAMQIYVRGVQLAAAHGTPLLRGTADMYVGMSEILSEQNELSDAMQQLLRCQAQGEHTGFPQYPYRWCVAMACLHQAQGNLHDALTHLDRAEQLYVSDMLPNVRPVAALKARVWIAQGRIGEALGWARAQGLSAQDELSFLREYEHITLARLLLARNQSVQEAIGLLQRLCEAAEAGQRMGSLIEILVLQALAYQLHGSREFALEPLTRALTLAEPEGYVRVFVEAGPPMVLLLRAALARGIAAAYCARLLAACEAEQPTGARLFAPPSVPLTQPLIEPLSQRELAVLRLLNSELSGPEIARELMIALSTVRTYTKSIYSKLSVNNRRAAVKRATELGLLGPHTT